MSMSPARSTWEPRFRSILVVILDAKMPGMDGIETLQEIKKISRAGDLRQGPLKHRGGPSCCR
jgi:CheY-like chemotaxis protein